MVDLLLEVLALPDIKHLRMHRTTHHVTIPRDTSQHFGGLGKGGENFLYPSLIGESFGELKEAFSGPIQRTKHLLLSEQTLCWGDDGSVVVTGNQTLWSTRASVAMWRCTSTQRWRWGWRRGDKGGTREEVGREGKKRGRGKHRGGRAPVQEKRRKLKRRTTTVVIASGCQGGREEGGTDRDGE